LSNQAREQFEFFKKPLEDRTAEEKKLILPFFKSVAAFKDIGIQDSELAKLLN